MSAYVYHSFAKEHLRVECLPSVSKREVGAPSSVLNLFAKELVPMQAYTVIESTNLVVLTAMQNKVSELESSPDGTLHSKCNVPW